MINHFGIKIVEKPKNHINKELYLSSKPEGIRGWDENSYELQRIKADINYDANLKFFESLDEHKFNKMLNKLVRKFRLKECKDLKKLDGVNGLYVMVLDKYKQIYIGITEDIKFRIHKGHWTKTKSLERLIYGDMFSSRISIDSFGSLDTTRIFYTNTNKDLYLLEEKIVDYASDDYILNRTKGGIGSYSTYTDDKQSALLSAIADRKKRNLIAFTNLKRLEELPKDSIRYYLEKYPELKDYEL